jgi:glutamine amidotransferase
VKEVTVLTYGAGNVASVQFALERLGAAVRLTNDPVDVAEAERLILPGVGTAGYAMRRLDDLGLTEAVRAFRTSPAGRLPGPAAAVHRQ